MRVPHYFENMVCGQGSGSERQCISSLWSGFKRSNSTGLDSCHPSVAPGETALPAAEGVHKAQRSTKKSLYHRRTLGQLPSVPNSSVGLVLATCCIALHVSTVWRHDHMHWMSKGARNAAFFVDSAPPRTMSQHPELGRTVKVCSSDESW